MRKVITFKNVSRHFGSFISTRFAERDDVILKDRIMCCKEGDPLEIVFTKSIDVPVAKGKETVTEFWSWLNFNI